MRNNNNGGFEIKVMKCLKSRVFRVWKNREEIEEVKEELREKTIGIGWLVGLAVKAGSRLFRNLKHTHTHI